MRASSGRLLPNFEFKKEFKPGQRPRKTDRIDGVNDTSCHEALRRNGAKAVGSGVASGRYLYRITIVTVGTPTHEADDVAEVGILTTGGDSQVVMLYVSSKALLPWTG